MNGFNIFYGRLLTLFFILSTVLLVVCAKGRAEPAHVVREEGKRWELTVSTSVETQEASFWAPEGRWYVETDLQRHVVQFHGNLRLSPHWSVFAQLPYVRAAIEQRAIDVLTGDGLLSTRHVSGWRPLSVGVQGKFYRGPIRFVPQLYAGVAVNRLGEDEHVIVGLDETVGVTVAADTIVDPFLMYGDVGYERSYAKGAHLASGWDAAVGVVWTASDRVALGTETRLFWSEPDNPLKALSAAAQTLRIFFDLTANSTATFTVRVPLKGVSDAVHVGIGYTVGK